MPPPRKLDGVILGLHGAMVAQGYDDVEGDIVSRVRGIVGASVTVAATFDPHSHMTRKRFEALDILTAFKVSPPSTPSRSKPTQKPHLAGAGP